MNTCRIAMIGCGAIAHAHAAALRGIDGAELTVCCDLDIERAEALREAGGARRTTVESVAVFGDPDVDAVYICTRHDSHADLAMQAIAAGKHVFLEKPLAMTVEDCARIGEALERSDVSFMTGFKMRFMQTVDIARSAVPHPYLAVAQVCDERWPDDFWANDPLAGGGNVFSQGCHAMDLVTYLIGAEPVRVYAEGGNRSHPGSGIIDTLAATVTFGNGAVASVVMSDAGISPVVSKWSFQIFNGTDMAHVHDRMQTVMTNRGGVVDEYIEDADRGIARENEHFVQCVRRGLVPTTGFRDGYRATVMILKAFESLQEGLPVEIRPAP